MLGVRDGRKKFDRENSLRLITDLEELMSNYDILSVFQN